MSDAHDPATPTPTPDAPAAASVAAGDPTAPPAGRPSATGLGEQLRAARERAGLDLSALAQRTHVRRAYLEALEQGRYGDLPEDVFARNFVRLYAQAVGLDVEPLYARYAHERQAAIGRSTLELRLDRDRRQAAEGGTPTPRAPVPSAGRGPATTPRPRRVARGGRRVPAWFGSGLATVALVAVVVGLAACGVDRLFSTPAVPAAATSGAAGDGDAAAAATSGAAGAADAAAGATAPGGLASPSAPADAPAAGDGPASGAEAPSGAAAAGSLAGPGAASDRIVRVAIVTDPPGASVTVDGFAIPGRTPLTDVPLTARSGRVVRAELEGHVPAEARVDLDADAEVRLVLAPVAAAGDAAPTVGPGAVRLDIVDTTWLEVYTGAARNAGERLVYTTAQPGATYAFDLPVFVYVGNAAGVRVTLEGQELGAMGGPGAVLGRAFGR